MKVPSMGRSQGINVQRGSLKPGSLRAHGKNALIAPGGKPPPPHSCRPPLPDLSHDSEASLWLCPMAPPSHVYMLLWLQ